MSYLADGMSPLRGSLELADDFPRLTPWATEIPPLRGRLADFFTAPEPA